MTKQAIIERTLKAIDLLPENKAEEISNFAEFIFKRYEESQITEGIESIVSNSTTYNFLKEEFKSGSGIELSRNSLKELLFVILFGNEKKLNSIRLGDNNYKDLESLLLGNSRFLINDLKNISLFSWYKNKDYKKYKNVSLILMRLERKLMDVMSNIMIQNKFDYISLFDGFMVRKSEVNEIEKLLNSHLESIDKVFRLVVK